MVLNALKLAVTALLVSHACASPVKKPPTIIDTDYGPVEGVYESDVDLVAFYGIPFAHAPVGDLRLRPPIEPVKWTKPRDCKRDEYFHICPQFPLLKDVFVGESV